MEQIDRDFGKDWLSAPAHDLAAVAVNLAGYPAREVARRLAVISPGRRLNIRSVERVLGEIDDDDPDHAPRSHR